MKTWEELITVINSCLITHSNVKPSNGIKNCFTDFFTCAWLSLFWHKCHEDGLPQLTLYQYLKSVARAMAEDAGFDLDQPSVSTHVQNPPTTLTERHFPDFVPETLSSTRPLRRCVVCSKVKRKETRYQCIKCDVGLCVINCFEKYHTLQHYN